ncbi:MAG: NAD(P)/FAD-dependent oxidoreductase, partial [Propionibacteriaceae bacterium]
MDITLIAATGQHLFRPLLYQVATGILSPGDIAPSTREILRRQHNVTVLLGTVIELDLNAKVITSEVGSVQSFTGYDTLVLAAGAMTSYCGHDEYAGFAPGMKSIDDALELRGRILGAFELVERATDPVEQERLLTFAIVGGDPTGVELAGQVSERRPGRDPSWPVMRPTIRARLDRRSAPGGPGAAHAPAPFRYFDKGS